MIVVVTGQHTRTHIHFLLFSLVQLTFRDYCSSDVLVRVVPFVIHSDSYISTLYLPTADKVVVVIPHPLPKKKVFEPIGLFSRLFLCRLLNVAIAIKMEEKEANRIPNIFFLFYSGNNRVTVQLFLFLSFHGSRNSIRETSQ